MNMRHNNCAKYTNPGHFISWFLTLTGNFFKCRLLFLHFYGLQLPLYLEVFGDQLLKKLTLFYIFVTWECKPLLFQALIIWLIHSLNYLRSMTWICKYIKFRKPEFVTKTQFLCYCIGIKGQLAKKLTLFYKGWGDTK